MSYELIATIACAAIANVILTGAHISLIQAAKHQMALHHKVDEIYAPFTDCIPIQEKFQHHLIFCKHSYDGYSSILTIH